MIVEPSPGVHDVPAARGMTGVHTPLPHCWYEVPRHTHSPSGLHAEPAVWALPLPLEPDELDGELLGDDDVAAGVGESDGVSVVAAGVEAAGVEAGGSAAEEAPPVGTVTKTAGEAEVLSALSVGDAAAGVEAEGVEAAGAAADPPVAVGPQLPVGKMRSVELKSSTESPGLGYL